MKSVVLASYEEALGRLAQDFSAEGFQVQYHPNRVSLPSFLTTETRIDLVARRSDKNMVVAVRTHAEFQKDQNLVLLADALKAHPTWQLFLCIYDAVVGETFADPEPPDWPSDTVYSAWEELHSQVGHPCTEREVRTALQLAEVVLCQLDPRLRQGSASLRLRQAFTDGWLSQEQLDFFLRALAERRGKQDVTLPLDWEELIPALSALFQVYVDHAKLSLNSG